MIYNKNVTEVLNGLQTSTGGLTSIEASKRNLAYGKNTIPEGKKNSLIVIFLKQFISPIIIVLLVAMVLCLIVDELSNAIFIFAVVTINSLIGAMQEVSAEKSASKLKNMIKIKCKVIRDNNQIELESSELTIGDIVVLETGDKISADIRIIKAHSLLVDESILTGESLPVSKTINEIEGNVSISECSNCCYAGTIVTSGRSLGVVYAIGLNTEFGKIASSIIDKKDTKSPLIIRMDRFIKQITQMFAIFSVVVSILLYFKGYIVREIFFLIISLTVSAIPEGLSIAMSVALSKSSARMAKENVIVKKLNAVESLGSCTVIASDKTGTLTKNEQTAMIIQLPNNNKYLVSEDIYLVDEVSEIIKLGALNNEAVIKEVDNQIIKLGDSIDVAFKILGIKGKANLSNEVYGMIPYESEAKYSAVFYDAGVSCKGSVEKILDFSDKMIIENNEVGIDKELILEQNQNLASLGYRVIALAFAHKKVIKGEYDIKDIPSLTFLGLVGFIDPIRDDVYEAVKTTKQAGIKTVMITGDHPLTAFAIAKELEMLEEFSEVVTGSMLEQITDEKEFDEVVNKTKVFARVTPLQKLAIIDSYKRLNEFVAVTGDGVNDSPALKSANIGIAMGSGTDIAKETGNMIISDDNFTSIVKGVKEGRIAYSNIRNVIYLLLSTGFSEIILFLLAILFNLPTPMIAVQLLWLNLITNGIQDVALAFEKGEDFVMKQKPRSPKEGIFNKLMLQQIFTSAILIGLIAFIFYFLLIKVFNCNEALARTYVLLLMIFFENAHIFNCRSERTSFFKLPLSNNRFVIYSLFTCLVIQVIITTIQTPLTNVLSLEIIPFYHIFLIILLVIPLMVTMELFKYFKRHESI